MLLLILRELGDRRTDLDRVTWVIQPQDSSAIAIRIECPERFGDTFEASIAEAIVATRVTMINAVSKAAPRC